MSKENPIFINKKNLSQGGYEAIFPDVVEAILTNENPEDLALKAGLTKRQWETLELYLETKTIGEIAANLGLQRANIYFHLNSAFIKLHRNLSAD